MEYFDMPFSRLGQGEVARFIPHFGLLSGLSTTYPRGFFLSFFFEPSLPGADPDLLEAEAAYAITRYCSSIMPDSRHSFVYPSYQYPQSYQLP
jgi:hypothetical protein